MPELKRCPFCGADAAYQSAGYGSNDYAVYCTNPNCGASTLHWLPSKEEATKKWNRRKDNFRIKPCHYCGDAAILRERVIKPGLSFYSVYCSNKNCTNRPFTGNFLSMNEAIRNWNKTMRKIASREADRSVENG